jgi:molybdopterin adenylyltransferase
MGMRIGILTVSDRVSAGQMQDHGGPAVEDALEVLAAEIVRGLVPDEQDQIAQVLRRWADDDRLDAIFTTGGTGLGPRDVTPDATLDACDRGVPGIAEAMRQAGIKQTPHAMLSRAVCGARGRTLIVNLPGSPRGACEGVEVVLPILEHAIATMHGGKHA